MQEVSAAHDNHSDTAAASSLVGFAADDCSVDHDDVEVFVVQLKTTLHCITLLLLLLLLQYSRKLPTFSCVL